MGSHPKALYQLRLATRIFAVAVMVAVLSSFFLPHDYRIQRDVTIAISEEALVTYLGDASNWPKWMYIHQGKLVASLQNSSGMAFEIKYDSGKKGQFSVEEVSNHQVVFNVVPKMGQSTVLNTLTWTPFENGIKVSWAISGEMDAGLLSPYLALFANDIAGSNFEKSLAQLKKELQ